MAFDLSNDPTFNVGLTGGQFIDPAKTTPAQRAMLYQYANQLMQPQPIRNGWQGLASMANALVGGLNVNRANQQEMAANQANIHAFTPSDGSPQAANDTTQGASATPSPPMAAAPPNIPGDSATIAAARSIPTSGVSGPSLAVATGGGAGSPSPALAAHTAQAAAARGIDPAIATRMFAGESQFDPAAKGDVNAQGQPTSFGVPQLHYTGDPKHPAMGDLFTRDTGLDARNPANAAATIDYALDQVKTQGWAPWATTRDKLGIDNFTGVGRAPPPAPVQVASNGPMAYAPPTGAVSAPPAVGAVNGPGPGVELPMAPASGVAMPPVQMAQNSPRPMFTPQQLGYQMGSANVSPQMQAMARELIQPKMMTDVYGNVSGVSPNVAPNQPPIFRGGAAFAPSNFNGATVTPIVGPNGGATGIGPTGPIGAGVGGNIANDQGLQSLIRFGQNNAANAGALNAQAGANQARFEAAHNAPYQLQKEAQPLLQIKQIMDAHGGVLPTGEGSEQLLKGLSLANTIGTLMGHPMASEDSTLPALEQMSKYGKGILSTLGMGNTDMGRELARGMVPSPDLSSPTNAHLVDNYLRLNQLAQKRAALENNMYLQAQQNGQGAAHAYDNIDQAWQAATTGANAVPLSGEKYGRKIEITSPATGQKEPRIVVPSTDTKGYSSYRPGTIPEVATP